MQDLDELIDGLLSPDHIESTKYLCLSSFEAYFKTIFFIENGFPPFFVDFHSQVCKKLEDIVYCRNEKRNLAINVPVGSGKSLIVEYFISWCFARTNNNTFLYTSHSDGLINRLSREIRDIVTHPSWILLFGYELKKDERAKTNWSFQNAMNRTGLTAGVMGGSLTGLDAGHPSVKNFSGALIIDDPHDATKVRYANSRKLSVDFFDNKLATRRRTPTTPTILVMQRLHKEDLTGWIEEHEIEDWDILSIPAISAEGKSFWPSRYPVSDLKKIERTSTYKFMAQYQQAPITGGGNVIKVDMFGRYEELPMLRKRWLTIDTAQKDKDIHDYTVFQCWGLGYDNKVYLIDLYRKKLKYNDLKVKFVEFWNKHKNALAVEQYGHLTMAYIEDKSSGSSLIQEAQAEAKIPVQAIQRSRSKVERVNDILLPKMACGYVCVPAEAPWLHDLFSECEEFSDDMTHKHDDQIDPMIDGVEIGTVNSVDNEKLLTQNLNKYNRQAKNRHRRR